MWLVIAIEFACSSCTEVRFASALHFPPTPVQHAIDVDYRVEAVGVKMSDHQGCSLYFTHWDCLKLYAIISI